MVEVQSSDCREGCISCRYIGTMYSCCWQTTSVILWVLHCLARSADVQDAVYRDTVAVLADSSGHVTPDSLQRLNYIRACVKETFRLR